MMPLGSYVPCDSLYGCTRTVSDDIVAKRAHLEDEVRPFLRDQEDVVRWCNEVESLYFSIYNVPIGNKIGQDGKIVVDSREKR